MRISTAMAQQQGINAVLEQQAKLSKIQMQITSETRILNPSDDPAASSRVIDLQQSIAQTEQYQDNIDTAYSRLTLEEDTLDGATDILQRLRELAVQAVNDTLSEEDRTGIEEEARQLLDEFMGLANTKNANGEYIFSGYSSQTVPFSGDATSGGFTWNGDTGSRELKIGDTRQIQDGDSGYGVFWDVEHTSGTNQSIFQTIYDFANNISAAVDTPTADDITNIDYALDSILETRSIVGARINALEQQESLNDSYLLDMETVLSDTQDLDLAEAASQLSLQTTTLEAAQQAYLKVQGLSLFNYL